MNLSYSKLIHFSFATLFTLGTSVTALADDIDLYITSTTGSSTVQPNVIFVIDSSGSMDEVDVPVTTVTCTANSDKFIDDRIYFFKGGVVDPDDVDPDGFFAENDNHCDIIKGSLNSVGQSLGSKLIVYSGWFTKKWNSLNSFNKTVVYSMVPSASISQLHPVMLPPNAAIVEES